MNKNDDIVMPMDSQLVAEFQAGKESAFNQLVLIHQDGVYDLCCRILGRDDEAEDVAQECFVNAYKALKRFRQDSSFSTWIYRIAVNGCRNRLASAHFRMKKKAMSIDRQAGDKDDRPGMELKDSTYIPDRMAERNETGRLIQAALDSLPLDLKSVVVLCDVQGRSYAEAAEVMGLKEGTLKSRLFRAREQLKKCLQGVI